MAFGTATREMYCPKCNDSFEEGSRRFCPTDGARLISGDAQSDGGRERGGVFSNLIPKMSTDNERDNVLSSEPKQFSKEPEFDRFREDLLRVANAEPFFEIADLLPENEPVPSFAMSEPPASVEPDPLEMLPPPVRVVPPPPIQRVPEPPPAPVVAPVQPPPISLVPDSPPVGRKVNPFDIPAGHVELDDVERKAGLFNEFEPDRPEDFIGRTVKGRYRVTEFLGDDETGLNYLADDRLASDKMVTVRILLEDQSDEIMNSILAEERVSLSHFSHPNVARLIDSGEFNDGTQFLVSEHVDALSVRDVLSIHGHFDPVRAARVIRQVSYALNEAHQEGIIHRDVCPENIILATENGAEQTKLINLGASSGDPNQENAAYKASEVLDGRIPTVASDIFSLAVVAHEMVVGRVPFKGSTAKEIIRVQYAGLTALPSTERPGLPIAVDEVLSKALAFNAANRYPKAREFGDAFYAAIVEPPHPIPISASSIVVDGQEDLMTPIQVKAKGEDTPAEPNIEIIKPIVMGKPAPKPVEPAWKNRSPEPPQEATSRFKIFATVGILLLLAMLAGGWYYVVNHPSEPALPTQSEQNAAANNAGPGGPQVSTDIEVPPLPRKIDQPPNTDYFQSNKSTLKGDLVRNFVGFSIYYPKDWKVIGPQESTVPNTRGKFLDISRSTPDGKLKEQMLISYYPSKGTFKDDADKFPAMVKETNETLKKILPGYQMVAERETKINGDWRAYEVKFQGGGTAPNGDKLLVWGRRLFIPAARPGTHDGFEITMIATSLADDVKSVDDVGVNGELSAILATFEPSQNF